MKEQIWSKKKVRNRTIISFVVFFAMIGIAYYAWKWLYTQPEEAGALKPLRKVLDQNEEIFKPLVGQNNLVKTYPKEKAEKVVRVNGWDGIESPLDSNWKLKLVRKNGDTVFITLDEIKKLPKTEIVFDFKCVEGWNQITHWGGVKFSDFAKYYKLDSETQMEYVGMITPDKGYYVGIDMPSAIHPQTILCYEMNGKALPLNQGFPLRLIIPVKYGVKHIKRIGTIYFSNTRPPDFWAEQGYDYFLGL